MIIKNDEVGFRIKHIRLSKGWTLEELGEKLNTSKVTVFNWEKGRNKPNKENLKRLAELGGITVDELLYGSVTEIGSYINDKIVLENKLDDTYDEFIAEIEYNKERLKKNLSKEEAEELLINNEVLQSIKHAKNKYYNYVKDKYSIYILYGIIYLMDNNATLTIDDFLIDANYFDTIQVEKRTVEGVETLLEPVNITSRQQIIDTINKFHDYNVDIKLVRNLTWDSSLNEYDQILNY